MNVDRLKLRFRQDGWSVERCAEICIDEMEELLSNYCSDVDLLDSKMTSLYFEMLEKAKNDIYKTE